MTPPAVVHRERNAQVTYSAEPALVNKLHSEMLRRFLFDIEDVGVTVRTIQPDIVGSMGEHGRREIGPLRLHRDDRIKCKGSVLLGIQALLRADESLGIRFTPVNSVTIAGLREIHEITEPLCAASNIIIVAPAAIALRMSEGYRPVMTGATVLAILIPLLRDLRRVHLHLKSEFEMTYAAGVVDAMLPMGETYRGLPCQVGPPIDEHVPVFRCLTNGREFPGLPPHTSVIKQEKNGNCRSPQGDHISQPRLRHASPVSAQS